jgi:hypothetical protein
MKICATSLTNRIFKIFYGLYLLVALLFSFSGFSQGVAVNTTGNPPNASAGLDVDFPDKGILIPRVALTGTSSSTPLPSHVAGMIVYNTATTGNVKPGFYFDNGTNWVPSVPAGNAAGDMLFWDGSVWVVIPAGTTGQLLQSGGSGMPVWVNSAAPYPTATLTTTTASAITGITATSGGNITSDAGLSVLARGVCWSTIPGPTTANSKTTDGSGTGVFTSSLTGLSPVTTYYVRAYATNSAVTTYGNQVSFITLPVLPTLITTTASAITGTTATSGGNVTNDGGATITERGICYGTTANPTTANTKVIDPSPGVGVFVSNLTSLTGYTTYHVRAYAINITGTAYGNDISFTTLTIPPTLVTVAASNIMSTTATSGGSMTWNVGGYSNYQNYGVAYATVPNAASPTFVATNTTNGSVNPLVNIPPWVTNLTGLVSNTTYYIRSYLNLYQISTSSWVTVFGNELSFTTALIQTTPICTVTTTTAVSGGTIGAVSGVTITARGVCWNTSPAPTLSNSFTTDGSGTGTYVSNLTGLTNATTYYVRSYCTNNLSITTYGNELSFKTGTPHVVGDALAGGKVIYVDCTGQHGLIGALVDQGSGVAWGCYGTVVGASGSAIYTGLANTNLIVAACGAGTAAQLCAAYTAGGTGLTGITNWYLPSHDELQILVDQRTVVGLTTTPSYASSGVYYWSSTEYGGSSAIAYGHYSLVSTDYNQYKNATYYPNATYLFFVRAVRAF